MRSLSFERVHFTTALSPVHVSALKLPFHSSTTVIHVLVLPFETV